MIAKRLRGLQATRRLSAIPIVEPPPQLHVRILDALTPQAPVIELRVAAAKRRWAPPAAFALLGVAAAIGLVFVSLDGGLFRRNPLRSEALTTAEATAANPAAVAEPPAESTAPVALAAAEQKDETPSSESQRREPRPSRHSTVESATAGKPKAMGGGLDDRERSFAKAPSDKTPASGDLEGWGGTVASRQAATFAAPQSRAAAPAAPAPAAEAPKAVVAPAGGPDAALVEARRVRDTQGCGAALVLFDRVAQQVPGTATGFAATYDGALCHEAIGDRSGARSRLETLRGVAAYRERVQSALSRISNAENP